MVDESELGEERRQALEALTVGELDDAAQLARAHLEHVHAGARWTDLDLVQQADAILAALPWARAARTYLVRPVHTPPDERSWVVRLWYRLTGFGPRPPEPEIDEPPSGLVDPRLLGFPLLPIDLLSPAQFHALRPERRSPPRDDHDIDQLEIASEGDIDKSAWLVCCCGASFTGTSRNDVFGDHRQHRADHGL